MSLILFARAISKGEPVKVYNIGCSNLVKLMDFIAEFMKWYRGDKNPLR